VFARLGLLNKESLAASLLLGQVVIEGKSDFLLFDDNLDLLLFDGSFAALAGLAGFAGFARFALLSFSGNNFFAFDKRLGSITPVSLAVATLVQVFSASTVARSTVEGVGTFACLAFELGVELSLLSDGVVSSGLSSENLGFTFFTRNTGRAGTVRAGTIALGSVTTATATSATLSVASGTELTSATTTVATTATTGATLTAATTAIATTATTGATFGTATTTACSGVSVDDTLEFVAFLFGFGQLGLDNNLLVSSWCFLLHLLLLLLNGGGVVLFSERCETGSKLGHLKESSTEQ
jgi:hypothetical protein